MRKWWKVNRQSLLSEYDETLKDKGLLSLFTWEEVGLMVISLTVYFSVLTLTLDWVWYVRYPISCISYIIIYVSLLVCKEFWKLKQKNKLIKIE